MEEPSIESLLNEDEDAILDGKKIEISDDKKSDIDVNQLLTETTTSSQDVYEDMLEYEKDENIIENEEYPTNETFVGENEQKTQKKEDENFKSNFPNEESNSLYVLIIAVSPQRPLSEIEESLESLFVTKGLICSSTKSSFKNDKSEFILNESYYSNTNDQSEGLIKVSIRILPPSYEDYNVELRRIKGDLELQSLGSSFSSSINDISDSSPHPTFISALQATFSSNLLKAMLVFVGAVEEYVEAGERKVILLHF